MSDRPASLVARIVRAAEEHPERVAVVCDGVHVSYRALIASAFDVAGRLRSLGIRFDEPVGIASIRGAEFVAGAIGAMAAGGCYLPLDVTQPGERLRMLVARSGIRLALAPDTCAWLGDVRDLLPVAISTSTSAVSFDVTQNDSQLAYQLFTSGSTGVPKLVPIEQRSVCALLDGIDAIARPKASVISTCVCPFSFDVSVWELFSALANAGTVHILSTGLTDPAKFVRYLADHAVTSVYIPPFVLDSFVDELHLCGGARALDRILVGVEPITQATLQRLRDLSPDLHILNGYGPTEATICSTIFPFKQAHEPNKRTPIGWPVPGWRVDVVDSDLSPVADGANGEIVVGGPGLAHGYVGDPWQPGQRVDRRQCDLCV